MTEILHKTRSMRLIIRPASTPASAALQAAQAKAGQAADEAKKLLGQGLSLEAALLLTDVSGGVAAVLAAEGAAKATEIVIENLEGNNGLEMRFVVRRGIDMATSSAAITIFNLPDSDLARIAGEARSIGRIEDIDLGGALWPIGADESPDGAGQATPASLGYAGVELQAGYDGNLSTIFAGTLMGCDTNDELGQTRDWQGRFTSGKMHGVTSETTLTASSGIVQSALSSACQTFEAGTNSFTVLDALRRTLRLGPGNCTPENWLKFLNQAALHKNKSGQALFSATSALSAPYIIADAADEQLEQFLKYTGVRHFVDEGQLWLVPRIGFIDGTPARLDRLKERPRSTPSGQLECKVFLTPGVQPGHLVVLDEQGIDETLAGEYRVEHFDHEVSSNAGEEASTTLLLAQRHPVGAYLSRLEAERIAKQNATLADLLGFSVS